MSTEEVRRELHAALDTIDVPPPDPGALLARAQSRSGPPRAAWVLFAACVVIVGVAATSVVKDSGGREVTAEPDDWVPATSQALAALAIERLDLDPEVRVTGLPPDVAGADEFIASNIVFEPVDGMYFGPRLSLGVHEEPEGDVCNEFPDGCATLSAPRGEVTLVWAADEGDPDDPSEADDPLLGMLKMYGVAWNDPDTGEFELVFHQGSAFDGDPRDADVLFEVDDLVGLLTDERFGPTTTQELVDVELPGWTDVPDMGEVGGEEFDEEAFNEELANLPEKTEKPLAGDVPAMVERHLGMPPKKVQGWLAADHHASVDVRLPSEFRQELFLTVHADASFAMVSLPCKIDPTFECATWDLPAGQVTLSWPAEGQPEGLGILQVALEEGDEWQMVSMMFSDDTKLDRDPRELDLPISVDQLVALLSDPGVTLP